MADAKRTCSTDNCDRPHRSRGLCGMHYDRWRAETPKADRPPLTPAERFAAKTLRDADTGCLIWTGARDPRGYGRVGIGESTQFAHRIALEATLGRSLLTDHLACHSCDNPSCVEPAHLFEGTHADNMDDCTSKARQSWGERNARHKLTESDVRTIRTEVAQGTTKAALARRFGVRWSTVHRAATGQRWAQLT